MKHLGVLTDCGLLSIERRGRERWNYLNAVRLREAADRWLTPFQSQWSEGLSSLKQHLKEKANMTAPSLGLDIRQETELPASPERVFVALTRDINHWWGAKYRQAGDESVLVLVPEIGSDMVERSSHGHAVIWGRVEEVRRPNRLYLSGRFGVKGAVAGRVHFDLDATGDGNCRLVVSHQAVGAIAEEMQSNFVSGWKDLIGERLRAQLEQGR
jgi:uncharacterized protein YndB with AHSA1/START domain